MSIIKDLQAKAKLKPSIITTVYDKIIKINSEALFSSYPDSRVLFPLEIQNDVIESTGLSRDEITSILKRSSSGIASNKISGEPMNSAMMLYIHHFRKDRKHLEMCTTLLGILFYGSLFRKYFKHLPDANIVRGVINSMDETNDIVKYKTIFKLIQYKGMSNHHNMIGIDYDTGRRKKKDRFEVMNDLNFRDYISGLYTRLNQTLRDSISDKFYSAHKEGKYFNTVSSDDLPDWIDERNMSQIITKLSTKTTMSITQQVDSRIVRKASKETSVSNATLIITLRKIAKNEHPAINRMCMNILGLFLSNPKHKTEMVKSKYFEDECLAIYKKNNTADARIIELKELLEGVLHRNYDKYDSLPRDATRISYKKAVYVFLVISIVNYST